MRMPDVSLKTDWRDVGAGLCVAGLLLPEAVAYAGLAHLPVEHALVALMVGLLVYGLAGGSRFAIVAPTSSTATLSAAAALSVTGSAAIAGGSSYLQAMTALVMCSGVLLIVMGLMRQGQLSSYVSRPVLKGFGFALALSIVIKQLPDAFGFELPAANAHDPISVLVYTLLHVQAWHWASVAIVVTSLAAILILKRWPRLPGSMIVIVLAIALSVVFNFSALGVREVGALTAPSFQWGFPDLSMQQWMRVGELSFGLVMLIFAESWGSMRNMALAHGDALNANRELMVLGACNVGSALLQGMPVGAGFSATSANASAGAVSKRSGMLGFLSIVLVVALALPAVQNLPRPVLAAAVIAALWHALSIEPMLLVWRMNRDRYLLLASVLAVLVLGVLDGLLIAVGMSLLLALQRFSQPVVHELGELDNSRNYVDVAAQHGAVSKEGMIILRPEEPLFFGSAERVMNEVLRRVALKNGLHTVILSLEESADLDSTAAACLMELDQSLSKTGTRLHLARSKTAVRGLLEQCDAKGIGSPDRLHWSVADAVDATIKEQASTHE